MATTLDFESIFQTLKKQVEDLAKLFLQQYSKQAVKDGRKFLEDTRENLKRWTTLLSKSVSPPKILNGWY